jgi:hypothetical protein
MAGQLSFRPHAMEGFHMPYPIEAFLAAVNSGDADGVARHFTEDAVINDQMQELSGRRKILAWAEEDVVGLRMQVEVLKVRLRPTGAIISAKVAGDFDAPGLPEPLILLFYFSVSGAEIDQLIILRSGL